MNLTKTAASTISVCTATGLAILKATTGIAIGSLAVLSSAVDSILDIIASSINLFAIRKAEKPADKEHPFGHEKFESLATFIQSIIILATGVFIMYSAWQKIANETPVGRPEAGIIVMLISLAATGGLVMLLRHVAKQQDAPILRAEALHYNVDLLTGASVLASLFIVRLTGWHIIDPIVSVLISLHIMWSALKLAFDVSHDLLDAQVPEETREKIKEVIDGYDAYHSDYHRLRTRRAGSRKFVDLHLTLCKHLSLDQAHHIADEIEKKIEERVPGTDVIIHVEPCEKDNPDCPGTHRCKFGQIKERLRNGDDVRITGNPSSSKGGTT